MRTRWISLVCLVAALAPGLARASTTYDAPYSLAAQNVWCSPAAPVATIAGGCTGAPLASANDGTLHTDLTLTSGQGGVAPGFSYGLAQSMLALTFDNPSPVRSIPFTINVHVDSVSVSQTMEGVRGPVLGTAQVSFNWWSESATGCPEPGADNECADSYSGGVSPNRDLVLKGTVETGDDSLLAAGPVSIFVSLEIIEDFSPADPPLPAVGLGRITASADASVTNFTVG